MAKSQAKIFRTGSPAGWLWTYDRLDVSDGAIDNTASATNPNTALDAIKPLIGAMPGTISSIVITSETHETP